MIDRVTNFVRNYISRHANPLNGVLHVFGVPLAPFFCFYLLVRGRFRAAALAFVAGYALQWAGHSIQGNEVGEWTLVKDTVRKLRGGNANEQLDASAGDWSNGMPGRATRAELGGNGRVRAGVGAQEQPHRIP
jgi:Protein of unknown function (DUF962)